MAKQRVYQVARDLGLESKDVLERAQELGIDVKTASSGLDDDGVALVKLSFEESNGSAPAATDAETPPVGEAPPEGDETPVASTAEPVAELVAEPVAELQAEAAAIAERVDEGPVTEPSAAAEPVAAEEPEAATAEDRIIAVDAGITVHEFARMIGERTGEVVRTLMEMGELVPGGGTIPTAALEPLGEKFGYEVLVDDTVEEVEDEGRQPHTVEYEDDPASLKPRPPVVTVMGHVDHGKTQLLDTIRHANVVAGEPGGITQHIGAYQVTHNGSRITFIDTPGHEAFTALRARGANVTDIAVIVVAADDGVMPQTSEAISHALAAEVPIIVAINKMDLETADPYAVRAALTQHNIVVEELGGEVLSAEISALKGDGIDNLLELISLVAEVEEFTANPSAPAVGTVIESQLEVGRGPVATVIVQRGTLKRGDALVAGTVAGRVRAMFDEKGEQLKSAPPSTPVLVMGWDEVPVAGDMFQVVKTERTARKMAETAVAEQRAQELTVPTAVDRLGALLEQIRTEGHAEVRLIVKADAHGSLEALRESIGKIEREDGKIDIIHGAVGGISENDIMLAETADAVVYGFNVRPDTAARSKAKELGIDIRTFQIIYELLGDVEALLVGELSPEEVERFLGVAEVRETFRAPRYGTIAGSYVAEGQINRNARARLVRDGVVVYNGRIASLRRFKDDVPTVNQGFECGIGLENFRDIKVGDTIESYEVSEVART